MDNSRKRDFSKLNENFEYWSEDSSSAELEKQLKKWKDSTVDSNKKEEMQLFSDLIDVLKKLVPNVFKNDQETAFMFLKLIEDMHHIEKLIEKNEEYDNNIEYIIQAQKIGHQLKYITTINSGGLLDNIGQTTVEKYFNRHTSEYEQKFKEIKLLGQGGFGQVYVAKHKIDRMLYAVKKIKIKSHKKTEIQHSLDEVKTLAKLHHPNVVAYKNAWIELQPLQDNEVQSLSQSSEESSQSNKNDSMNGMNTGIQNFELNTTEEQLSENDSSQEALDIKNGHTFILYIQMALSKTNLRTLIDQKAKPFDELDIKSIAIQVLRGLNYIHQLKMVHHDINPNNILISFNSNEYEVQIADFGLACHLRKENHSEIGGTRPYSAPEQLANKCDSKSDVFSFGIVLFELLYPMNTDYERCQQIQNLKKGNDLPPEVINNYPVWDIIVKKSVNENPQNRYSAEELLLFISFKKNAMDEL